MGHDWTPGAQMADGRGHPTAPPQQSRHIRGHSEAACMIIRTGIARGRDVVTDATTRLQAMQFNKVAAQLGALAAACGWSRPQAGGTGRTRPARPARRVHWATQLATEISVDRYTTAHEVTDSRARLAWSRAAAAGGGSRAALAASRRAARVAHKAASLAHARVRQGDKRCQWRRSGAWRGRTQRSRLGCRGR